MSRALTMTYTPFAHGSLVAGKYRVERTLGMGGMGVVVLATHTQLDERVALKIMAPAALANPEAAGRFLREARLSVKLKSEHVARVMDVGTLDEGTPYMVMEYLEGQDLKQVLETRGPLPFADVAEYVIQACDAIAEAHAHGIVHRDLKPANLFLTRRPDGAPLVKVLDFGISKASGLGDADGGMTRTSTLMGSPSFMSPEQMRSARDADARSDVWSLGVIVYQLLTGRLPFEADTLGGIMASVLQDEPASISVYRPDVPYAFPAVVQRCLQRSRDARAQHVGEIVSALAPYAPARAQPIADRIGSMLGVSTSMTTSARVLGAAPVVEESSTSGSLVLTTPPPRRSALPFAILAGVALGVGGAAALFFFGGGARTASAPAAGAPAIVQEAPSASTSAAPVVVPGAPSAPLSPEPAETAAASATPPAPPASDTGRPYPAPAFASPRGRRPAAPPAAPVPPGPAHAASPAPPPARKSVLEDRN